VRAPEARVVLQVQVQAGQGLWLLLLLRCGLVSCRGVVCCQGLLVGRQAALQRRGVCGKAAGAVAPRLLLLLDLLLLLLLLGGAQAPGGRAQLLPLLLPGPLDAHAGRAGRPGAALHLQPHQQRAGDGPPKLLRQLQRAAAEGAPLPALAQAAATAVVVLPLPQRPLFVLLQLPLLLLLQVHHKHELVAGDVDGLLARQRRRLVAAAVRRAGLDVKARAVQRLVHGAQQQAQPLALACHQAALQGRHAQRHALAGGVHLRAGRRAGAAGLGEQGRRRAGAGLAQGWRRAGAGLAQGWRRAGGTARAGQVRSGAPPCPPPLHTHTRTHARSPAAGAP
jgi:hypothetical protein